MAKAESKTIEREDHDDERSEERRASSGRGGGWCFFPLCARHRSEPTRSSGSVGVERCQLVSLGRRAEGRERRARVAIFVQRSPLDERARDFHRTRARASATPPALRNPAPRRAQRGPAQQTEDAFMKARDDYTRMRKKKKRHTHPHFDQIAPAPARARSHPLLRPTRARAARRPLIANPSRARPPRTLARTQIRGRRPPLLIPASRSRSHPPLFQGLVCFKGGAAKRLKNREYAGSSVMPARRLTEKGGQSVRMRTTPGWL